MTQRVDNPIVDDVRKARADMARDCGYDLRKLLDQLKVAERTSGKPTRSPRDSGSKATA